ncbi:MAG: GtrA family protein [Candidatus Lokiarchaeota archaeon]
MKNNEESNINNIKNVEKSQIRRQIRHQMTLYLSFAVIMIFLNYTIQKINAVFIAPYICSHFGNNEFIKVFYCTTHPNMSQLVGSIVAVGITYLIKFCLDKFIVFQKKSLKTKQTSLEFIKYFSFAIFTTLLNVGIQFLLTNFIGTPLEINSFTALFIGYTVKFFLDRKYVFTSID